VDIPKWLECRWTLLSEYKEFEEEFVRDTRSRLAEHGLKVVKALPNMFYCGLVVANEEETKWIHITIPNVRENADWNEKIKLRRMSSERDWKGNKFHFTTYDNMAADAEKFMNDEYNDEIL